MRPQMIPVIVLAALAGLVVQGGTAVTMLGVSALSRPAAPQFAFAGVQDVIALPEMEEPIQPGQPVTPQDVQAARGRVVPVSEYTVSGPFTHRNLDVFLIHGPAMLEGPRVMTLQAALEQGLATVHEGLAVDNRAGVPLLIQAGDIVKGGIQDRVLPYDQLVPPGAVRQPLAALCVESGRSGPRGEELSTAFHSSMEQLPGKRLNLAARHRRAQGEVWAGVSDLQQRLNRHLGGSVQSPRSNTSLQLTLESPLLHRHATPFLEELARLPEGKQDVIGAAFVINGRIEGADVYASPELLRDLWPKLLRSHVVAALAEGPSASLLQAPTAESVTRFLADVEQGADCRRDTVSRTLVLRQESPGGLLFDTCDTSRENVVVHRSFLAR